MRTRPDNRLRGNEAVLILILWARRQNCCLNTSRSVFHFAGCALHLHGWAAVTSAASQWLIMWNGCYTHGYIPRCLTALVIAAARCEQGVRDVGMYVYGVARMFNGHDRIGQSLQSTPAQLSPSSPTTGIESVEQCAAVRGLLLLVMRSPSNRVATCPLRLLGERGTA